MSHACFPDRFPWTMANRCCQAALVMVLVWSSSVGAADAITSEQQEFFESKIRPVLIEHCYECHNSTETREAGLALDSRAGLRRGSDNGPVLDRKNPNQSLLLKTIRHEIEGSEMPSGGRKLDDHVIADFVQWVQSGAPDPRDHPPSRKELAAVMSWEAVRERRKQWWSFQPVTDYPVPAVQNQDWSSHPIDRFVLSRLEEHNLAPSAEADRRTLIRRLSYTLTGLPPTPEEIDRFLNDSAPEAYEQLVDVLLASDRFGEHWARHWMDWIRYAESHGSEGDPAIPQAFRYRDYLIRALNGDVPYHQLVREHIAGDLLPSPRLNRELGINESAIGTAHWRMVFHGFAPTDALDEKVRFTDDQINCFSKAFLGLTISCARCHDHKFDPISQRDYYALFGILGTTRPGLIDVNTPAKQLAHQERLKALKGMIRKELASAWMSSAKTLADRLLDPEDPLAGSIAAANQQQPLLHTWKQIQQLSASSEHRPMEDLWKKQRRNWQQRSQRTQEFLASSLEPSWNLTKAKDRREWFASGNGLHEQPDLVGDFTLAMSGPQVVQQVLPAGLFSHRLSTKHRAVFQSPRFPLTGKYDLWLCLSGQGKALARYVVQNYPRSGTVYPVTYLVDGHWRWQKYDVSYWNGEEIHIELATAADSAVLAEDVERSWFGIRHAVLTKKGIRPQDLETRNELALLFDRAGQSEPTSTRDLALLYQTSLQSALEGFQKGEMSDSQAFFLDACVHEGLLPNRQEQLAAVRPLIEEYRRLESRIPRPTRVPGLVEADVLDQPFFARGNHKQPGEPVPRRFLEVIDETPYDASHSGRLQLADDLLRSDNPLTARVIVNRVWHHLFGAGLVRTPDNFGQMGEEPSHPELLDYLANRFVEEGWSLKRLIRSIVLTRTWRLSSSASPLAMRVDPENRLLSHAHVRRLEAESIRDTLIYVAGQLDESMYGPSVGINNRSRRSLYLSVRRNSLDPFLRTFDFPVPFATTGRRDSTNVPAQSLTMLNDPFVMAMAHLWAQRLAGTDKQKIEAIFHQALGRAPREEELARSEAFLRQIRADYRENQQRRQKLAKQNARTEQTIAALLDPVRRQLMARKAGQRIRNPLPVIPIACWDFEEGNCRDRIGNMHGKLQNGARIKDGALILDGQGYVSTAPLSQKLTEKTLEVWVQLDDLTQRGGGAISLQDLSGTLFDAIVFGEKVPKHWLAGSNYFLRTKNFSGPEETTANQTPVHVAIAYQPDGTIRGFRNGKPYGTPYRKSSLQVFEADQAQILLGLRHGQLVGNRLLRGRILEARLYGRALSAQEILASFQGGPVVVSQSEIVNALDEKQRQQLAVLQKERTRLQAELNKLEPKRTDVDAWADLIQAVFNFKEFLYLR